MQKLLTFSLLILTTITMGATDVTLKLTYKNNPLCNWEVSLKQGNVVIGKAISNSEGIAVFNGVTLINNEVNAEGFKATRNGEKEWSVNGYIKLDESGYCQFDFQPVVEEAVKDAGLPLGMVEGSWGLTIDDCGNAPSGEDTAGSDGKVEQSSGSVEIELEEAPSPGLSPKEAAALEADRLSKEIAGIQDQVSRNANDLAAASDPLEQELYTAERTELNAKLKLRRTQLEIARVKMAGEAVDPEMYQRENRDKAMYDNAVEARKDVLAEVKAERRAKRKAERSESGLAKGIQKTKLKAQIKLKERAIMDEQNSFAPSEPKLELLRDELKDLQEELQSLGG